MKRQNDTLLNSMLEASKLGASFTLQEIGDALGLTRERVRQIESEALRKLRRKFSRGELKNALMEFNNPKGH